jgi:hypothetical protein
MLISIDLTMEAVSASEVSVSFYDTTQSKSQKTVFFILATVRILNLGVKDLTPGQSL